MSESESESLENLRLSAAERRAVRRAVAGVRGPLDSLQTSLPRPNRYGIRLHPAVVQDELPPDWIGPRFVALARATAALLDLDWSDSRRVGRSARKLVEEASEHAVFLVAELNWLTQFAAPSITLLIERVETLLNLCRAVIEATTATTQATANEALAGVEGSLDAFLESESSVALGEESPSFEDRTIAAFDHPDEIGPMQGFAEAQRRYVRKGQRRSLQRLVRRQFGTALAEIHFEPADAAGLFTHALHLAHVSYPLRAYRMMALFLDLAELALRSNEAESSALIAGFYALEAPRIIRTSERIATTPVPDDPIDFAMEAVTVYKRLCEGILRPLGNLVAQLADIVDGRGLSTTERPRLGDLEQRLGRARHPAPQFLLDVIDRELRNADAHEDVETGADGWVRLGDRTLTGRELDQRFWLLNSTLAGVDAGVALAGVRARLDRGTSRPRRVNAAFLRNLAHTGAILETHGVVDEVSFNSGTVVVRMRGIEESDRLGGLSRALLLLGNGDVRVVVVCDDRRRTHVRCAPASRADQNWARRVGTLVRRTGHHRASV